MQATDPNSHHQNFVGTLMTKFGHGKPTRGTDAKKDGQEQLRLSNEVIKCEIQSFENATSLSLHSGEKEHIVSFGKETTSEFAQVDIYRDLILRHLIKDINGTCERLQLPTGFARIFCGILSTKAFRYTILDF
jgi:hypothetical protein